MNYDILVFNGTNIYITYDIFYVTEDGILEVFGIKVDCICFNGYMLF